MAKQIIKTAPNERCFDMAQSEDTAEITLYGDVVSERPCNFFTGEEIPGDYIVQSEFVDELEKLDYPDSSNNPKKLHIRIHSFGGEVGAALVIYNRLRSFAAKGTEISCTVDGVAMSAGSLIICAADKIYASPASLIMIHKSLTGCCSWLNADELRKLADTADAYDKAIVAAYKRKTGKTKEELLALMSEETYMTGEEALEMGFVDELIQSDSTPEIAACADMSALIVGGRRIALHGAKCPGNIPIVSMGDVLNSSPTLAPASLGASVDIHINEGGHNMDNNAKDIIHSVPAVHAEGVSANTHGDRAWVHNASCAKGIDPVKKAADDERERLRKIDAIASQFSPDVVNAAKYENPCTAEEMAYRAAVQNAKMGRSFLDALREDYDASGARGVQTAVAPEDTPRSVEKMSDTEKMERARAEVRDVLGGDK